MGFIDDVRKALKADPRPDVEIARAAGIHPVFLSRWKTGRQEMGSEKIEALAHVLGLRIVVQQRKGGRSRGK